MGNGFIFLAFSWLVEAIKRVSIVEYFKKYFVKFTNGRLSNLDTRAKNNVAIDIFLIAKWLFLFFIWWNHYDGWWWISFTIYMIITNLHTYFYYHVWHPSSALNQQQASLRSKRRLVTLLMAVAYSNTCFAYLYDVCFPKDINWGKGINQTIDALQLSWGNGLAGSFGSSAPATIHGAVLIACQQILTFVFIAIILSKTIPSD